VRRQLGTVSNDPDAFGKLLSMFAMRVQRTCFTGESAHSSTGLSEEAGAIALWRESGRWASPAVRPKARSRTPAPLFVSFGLHGE
jgi:hypothetical protein